MDADTLAASSREACASGNDAMLQMPVSAVNLCLELLCHSVQLSRLIHGA